MDAEELSMFKKLMGEDKIWPTDRFKHPKFINSHTTQQIRYTYVQGLNGKEQTCFKNCNSLFEGMQLKKQKQKTRINREWG